LSIDAAGETARAAAAKKEQLTKAARQYERVEEAYRGSTAAACSSRTVKPCTRA